ncbi:hypothetical protein HYC85_000445 [Camellia sinensis]|uniref:Carbohydrate kinase PfkB domain-containing protein n=1 Tax=Camellia sinensis TaxID=4442 RepID=A0A7J7I438_CAMSI|nr:hypothetical protein HYC85_000445 [Camellia sinensis]
MEFIVKLRLKSFHSFLLTSPKLLCFKDCYTFVQSSRGFIRINSLLNCRGYVVVTTEMARRQALFPGDSEFQQLLHIFSYPSSRGTFGRQMEEGGRDPWLAESRVPELSNSETDDVQCAQVDEDEFGYMLADILKENNVNNEGMRFDPGARIALAFVTLRNDGEREFMVYCNPSADMLLQETELDYDLIRKLLSTNLITEPCKLAHIAAAKAAKDAGVILPYDPNLRLPLWSSAESAREGILSIWEIADIIKISEEEISFLTQGEDPYDDAVVRKLFHPNLTLLLVTEGPDGCRYYTKEFSGRVKGLKVDAVDTTGAGDAFVAGILSELAADVSLC